jgi:hypothetical protein
MSRVRTVNGGRFLALGAAASLLAAAPAAATPGPAARPVAIVATTGTPLRLAATGGRVALTARVVGADHCVFAGQRVAFGAHVVLARRACRSGTATATVAVAPNRHATGVRLAFTVRAVSASGLIVERRIQVQQAAAVPVLAIAPAAPPDGAVGEPYTFAFSAAGGKGPYSWAVSGTLPAGLHLSRGGVVSGTPTVGPATDGVEVGPKSDVSSVTRTPLGTRPGCGSRRRTMLGRTGCPGTATGAWPSIVRYVLPSAAGAGVKVGVNESGAVVSASSVATARSGIAGSGSSVLAGSVNAYIGRP